MRVGTSFTATIERAALDMAKVFSMETLEAFKNADTLQAVFGEGLTLEYPTDFALDGYIVAGVPGSDGKVVKYENVTAYNSGVVRPAIEQLLGAKVKRWSQRNGGRTISIQVEKRSGSGKRGRHDGLTIAEIVKSAK